MIVNHSQGQPIKIDKCNANATFHHQLSVIRQADSVIRDTRSEEFYLQLCLDGLTDVSQRGSLCKKCSSYLFVFPLERSEK